MCMYIYENVYKQLCVYYVYIHIYIHNTYILRRLMDT